jgi:ABC-2 type transport system permease protein
MTGWLKLTWVETKLYLREPGVYLGLVFPLALLLVFGAIYGNTSSTFTGGRPALDLYVPAYIAMLIAAHSLFSLPITLITYRERGILFRQQATPLRPQTILCAQVGANFLMTTVCAVILVFLGRVLYHLDLTFGTLNVLPAYILGVLSMYASGFVLASLLPGAWVAAAVSIVLFLALLYLSGVLLPLTLFPPALREAVQFLPLTHVVVLLQDLWMGANWSDHWGDVLALLGILLVCACLSARLFRWR